MAGLEFFENVCDNRKHYPLEQSENEVLEVVGASALIQAVKGAALKRKKTR